MPSNVFVQYCNNVKHPLLFLPQTYQTCCELFLWFFFSILYSLIVFVYSQSSVCMIFCGSRLFNTSLLLNLKEKASNILYYSLSFTLHSFIWMNSNFLKYFVTSSTYLRWICNLVDSKHKSLLSKETWINVNTLNVFQLNYFNKYISVIFVSCVYLSSDAVKDLT